MNAEQENTTIKISAPGNNNIIDTKALSTAQNFYLKGDYKEALRLFSNLVQTSTNAEVYLEIGNCFYMLEDYNSALDYWTKTTEIDPKCTKAYTNMGNLYYKLGQAEKAISLWIVALISKPEDAQTNLNLAIAFNDKGMKSESIKHFEKYIKYSTETKSKDYLEIKQKIQQCMMVAEQYLELGVQCQIDGDDKKAAACYFKSLANYPNLSKANLNLGSIFFGDKNLELAAKYWNAAAHLDPNYDKLYSNLAITYDLMKEFDYAYCYYYRYQNFLINNKEEYNKANHRLLKLKPYLNANPDLTKRHLALAKKHLANNEFFEAIDEFKNYTILKPDEGKNYKDIIKKLETYLNPEREIITTCFEIGNNLLIDGNYAEAKPYFARIMKLSSPQYLEFSKARAKFTSCDKML